MSWAFKKICLISFKAEAITNDPKHIIKDCILLAIAKLQLKWYLTVFLCIRMTKILTNDNASVKNRENKHF